MEDLKNSILIGMDGGVDSSVAVLLLKKEGYQVKGLIFRVHDEEMTPEDLANGKLPQNIWYAREAARRMHLDFSIIDIREAFQKDVMGYFIRECGQMRYPNPCVYCEEHFLIPRLLRQAEFSDCSLIATGHYAIIRYDPDKERYVICKALDQENDQSHQLYRIPQEILARMRTPLGGYRKEKIRKLAEDARLKNAKLPDGPEICFILERQHQEFLDGKISPEALEKAEDPMKISAFRRRHIRAGELHYAGLDHLPEEGMRLQARIRVPGNEAEGSFRITGDGILEGELDQEIAGAAPGQSIVLYDHDMVAMGGIIQK